MSYALSPGKRYRMPVQFGPALGPRESLDGGRHEADTTRDSLRVSVSFRSEQESLEALLPPGFGLDGEPVARIEASYMTGIPWLAGRGYNTLGLTIPVVWDGEETVLGDLVVVLFENLADPIISGREELGWNKLWCELPPIERSGDAACCRAEWLGFRFATVELNRLVPAEIPSAGAGGRPRLSYKYIPATGYPGEADVAYATVSPVSSDAPQVTELWRGDGDFAFRAGRWEDLPTLHRIVGGLSRLPRREVLGAALSRTRGSGDLHSTRRLR
jgi:Acetoacetate decarboxylase (ADC)